MLANNNFRIAFVLIFVVLIVTLIGNVEFVSESVPCECPPYENKPSTFDSEQSTFSRLDNLSTHGTPSPVDSIEEGAQEVEQETQEEEEQDSLNEEDKKSFYSEEENEVCGSLTPEQLLPPFPEQLPCPRRVPRSELPRCTNATQILRGNWDADKTWFEPDGCNIKRFTQEEAATCFAGRTIGFIGDSTIASLWRQTRKIFGEETALYGDRYDEETLKNDRRPGDPRLSFLTTYYHEKHQFLFRHYSLWKVEMLNTFGHEGRDANHTIVSVLQNKTHDAVFINLGAHHQPIKIMEGLAPMSHFYNTLDQMVRSKESVPVVYMSTNAQLAEKKKSDLSKHQSFRLSRVLNELAHWSFEVNQPQVVPMMDFSFLMEKGFPWSSHDGMHSVEEVEYVKWHIILNYMCPDDGFTTTIPN